MTVWESPLGAVLAGIGIFLAASVVLFGIAAFPILSHILYAMHLKRDRKKKKWGRVCSSDEPIQQSMFREGEAWRDAHADRLSELHMVNEGLNLYAEYIDLGFDRAVILVPGRTEGLTYGYYFAEPYAKMGYNVLAIDQRAHGKSDGRFNTLGFEEHKDLIAWAELLHEQFGVQSVVLHGICIGSSACLMALTADWCPRYIEGLVAEGMYPAFYESFRNHMIELKKPTFPALPMVDLWMRIYTGHSMKRGNINIIHKLDKPLLMLHSREDLYSLPERAQDLYDACGSERKELVWFEHGAHSKLRPTDKERYDSAITAFLAKNFAAQEQGDKQTV